MSPKEEIHVTITEEKGRKLSKRRVNLRELNTINMTTQSILRLTAIKGTGIEVEEASKATPNRTRDIARGRITGEKMSIRWEGGRKPTKKGEEAEAEVEKRIPIQDRETENRPRIETGIGIGMIIIEGGGVDSRTLSMKRREILARGKDIMTLVDVIETEIEMAMLTLTKELKTLKMVGIGRTRIGGETAIKPPTSSVLLIEVGIKIRETRGVSGSMTDLKGR